MRSSEATCLLNRFELPHPAPSYSGRFMRLLKLIVLMLFGALDHVRNQFPMCGSIAAQRVSHDLLRFTSMASH